MNGSTGHFEELGRLASALCDDRITSEQAARLEQLLRPSRRARRFFLQYVQLHGELYWDHAACARPDRPSRPEPLLSQPCPAGGVTADGKAVGPANPPTASSGERRGTGLGRLPYRWAAVAAAAALVVIGISLGTAFYRHWRSDLQEPPAPARVAQLTHLYEARWSEGPAKAEGAGLSANDRVSLRDGLAEIRFGSGARVILQGPVRFDVAGADCGALDAGVITAKMPPGRSGLTIRTPSATIVDRGTEFGVAVEDGAATEVHVFDGKVTIQLAAESTHSHEVSAGHAVRVAMHQGGSEPPVHEIEISSRRFVRAFPVPRSVARLRSLVHRHPNLIHHYTFEGVTPREKSEDKKGTLHLQRVVLQGWDGQGDIDDSAAGLDPTTRAIQPYRSRENGNENGVGFVSGRRDLGSQATFCPPAEMTIELLLSFAGFPDAGGGRIAAAVATRSGERDCGFLVAVAGQAKLVHLLQADAPWVEGDGEFAPDQWYYLASTFRVESGKTMINSYVANLSRQEPTLRHIVHDYPAPGEPPASELGIGKGFAGDGTHAYPWPGKLDEVAIYDAVLDQETLQRHLAALIGDG